VCVCVCVCVCAFERVKRDRYATAIRSTMTDSRVSIKVASLLETKITIQFDPFYELNAEIDI
jgi:hypothetical protein